MNRFDLQQPSKMRTAEGKCLLDAGRFAGSYYLMGYSVECALKAVVARRCRRYEFPDKGFVTSCHTHDLALLRRLAGLSDEFASARMQSAAFREHWVLRGFMERNCPISSQSHCTRCEMFM